ncbi:MULTISPECIES: glycosyltransferase [Caulobacter]|jgi:glycosyltransferase involved in cell wall biosynthesis|uniref:glycosyltransferase n=1 Tax=Caulobacter TaxID=75 RepID=UPI00078279F8|nr:MULTISPECIES: glycosyltransferase [Caulobacter]ATC24380.1 glycosyltransferase [Caulobacter vibrioides]MBQ1561723.1 glycosyltransferase [Caulobacter sp.]MCK5910932.1 glycosyltransferase [Caulobacter sp.]PIB97093.1 glycosyltransferase [Caulobacter sp. X]
MKICYVINSLDGGGGALPLPRILAVLRAAGHEVFVVSLMERDGLARPVLEATGTPYAVIGGAKRRFVRTALRLNRIVKTMAPDLIWTSLSHATVTGQLVGRLQGIPVVSWLHNAWLKPVNAMIMRATVSLTRHWIADSDTVAAFGKRVLNIDQDQISIWPIFQADPEAPVAKAADSGKFTIGSLGRLHPNKGYDVLIEALARLRDTSPARARTLQVLIAGDGPARADLQRRVAELKLTNVWFVGFVAPGPFLALLNGYVQPSHHEGFGIAAHEAMCAGLPVIASPVGEMANSIRASGGGVLVDYGDVEALAGALENLAKAPQWAFECGQEGRAWVMARYSRSAFATNGLAAIRAAGVGVAGLGAPRASTAAR